MPRILVLYANPITVSFDATLHREVVNTLRSREHQIDDCDLYAERFDPVLSEEERAQYHDVKLNRAHIGTYAIGFWPQKRSSWFIQFGMRAFQQS